MKKSHRFAFTMVEILAVTALISLLAAIGFGSYSYAMGRAKESSTRALVKQIEAGIEAFHAKYGYYPIASGNADDDNDKYGRITVTRGSDNMVQEIRFGYYDSGDNKKSYTIGYSTAPSNTKQQALKKAELAVFLKAVEPETLMKYLDGNNNLTDAYGGVIFYSCPGRINTTGFDLIAPGEDGGFGSGKRGAPRYTSTETRDTTLGHYKDSSNEWICDDIANF